MLPLVAVADVARFVANAAVAGVAKMLVHLGIEGGFKDGFGQLL